jgi:malonyl-CoA O-methyltransferase
MSIDSQSVARNFGSASTTYEAAASLQSQVRAELLSRLEVMSTPPAAAVDLGAGTGLGALAIKRRFRNAHVTAVDIAAPMLEQGRRYSRFWRPIHFMVADARHLPFATASLDLVFTNLMLQWIDPLDAALQEIHRVLRPGGLLLASSFGPQTLQELRVAWQVADSSPHVHDFVDMHDFGSALQRAGFAEPVLDVDRHLRHFADVDALLHELKALGARNASPQRRRGLTGRATLAHMRAAYETQRTRQGIPSTWQVVYAVAWVPAAQSGQGPAQGRAENGEVRIGLERLRASLGKRRA